MRVMITGARGMLGRTLCQTLVAHHLVPVDIDDFDITAAAAVSQTIRSVTPDVVIHCAAMTAVDDCEQQQQRAMAVNAMGAANVAAACHEVGAKIIAISTDYVFDGNLDRPYVETDDTYPQTVYGRSKLEGELAVARLCPNFMICRLGWLYGPGGPSFLHTMLRLGSETGPALEIVDDQVGNPTSTLAVAKHIERLLVTNITGIVHLTCEGQATWHEFAQEIFHQAGLVREIRPCTTAEIARPAQRPKNSRLKNATLVQNNIRPMPHWKDALTRFLSEYPHG